MDHVISRDGTRIAYDRVGQGPPLVLVDGALTCRANGPAAALARLLGDRFTVVSYDRRGRGDSGDTPPYAPEREIEDLEAILDVVGGRATVFGGSSGAALAAMAATRLPGITSLVLYEAPFVVDDTRPPITDAQVARITEALAAGRRGAAVSRFLKIVGVPAVPRALMRLLPSWRKLTASAHTLPYDFAIVGPYEQGRPLPAEPWASIRVPVLVMAGAESPTWMRNAQRAWAQVIPGAEHRSLPGQSHGLDPEVLAPILTTFALGVPPRPPTSRDRQPEQTA